MSKVESLKFYHANSWHDFTVKTTDNGISFFRSDNPDHAIVTVTYNDGKIWLMGRKPDNGFLLSLITPLERMSVQSALDRMNANDFIFVESETVTSSFVVLPCFDEDSMCYGVDMYVFRDKEDPNKSAPVSKVLHFYAEKEDNSGLTLKIENNGFLEDPFNNNGGLPPLEKRKKEELDDIYGII